MFSESRIADLPDVPTAREIGVNTVFEERVMAFAPKHTPKDRIAVLAKALEASLNDAEVVERLKALGVERQFIPGDQLVGILDGLKGPITRVGDEVKKAQAANKQ
jgi:tripartite-type tricarboxylate transporter receptor subunit TctC